MRPQIIASPQDTNRNYIKMVNVDCEPEEPRYHMLTMGITQAEALAAALLEAASYCKRDGSTTYTPDWSVR